LAESSNALQEINLFLWQCGRLPMWTNAASRWQKCTSNFMANNVTRSLSANSKTLYIKRVNWEIYLRASEVITLRKEFQDLLRLRVTCVLQALNSHISAWCMHTFDYIYISMSCISQWYMFAKLLWKKKNIK